MSNDGNPSPQVLAAARTALFADLAAVTLLGMAIALSLRGHFVKPHIDFFDFHDAAYAMQDGSLGNSYKRGPVFPFLLALGGWLWPLSGATDPPPIQSFAEWLNAMLLPVNGALCYLLGRRWMTRAGADGGSVWWTLWFLALPVGMVCTAHLLVEPLLITSVVATLLLAALRARWPAYAAAGVATLVRYDAAGLILGLLIADLASRRSIRQTVVLGLMSILPLTGWLALTLSDWRSQAPGHYLTQMAEHPGFDLLWSCRVVIDACLNPERLVVPVWAALDESWLRWAARLVLGVAVMAGAIVVVRKRDAAAWPALLFIAGYCVVHAAFPFRWPRFGYPPAPIALLWAGAGIAAGWAWLSSRPAWRPVRWLVAGFAAVIAAVLVIGEASALPPAMNWKNPMLAVHVAALAGLLAAVLARCGGVRASLASVCIGLGVAVVLRVHLREGIAALGDGAEAANMVAAARWVRDHTTAGDPVLSGMGGLLRLYSPQHGPRFLDFADIGAERWEDILAELAQRGVKYVIWDDAMFAERAEPLHAPGLRLDRFAILNELGEVPGLETVWSCAGRPNVCIWRVEPRP